jgi:hypothetical protein
VQVWWWWLACGPRPVVVDGPTVVVSELAPLAAELTVRTDVPTRLRVALRGEGVDLELAFPGLSREHVVPLVGARAGREIEVEVVVEGVAGGARTERTSYVTGPLPDDLPHIDVLRVDPRRVLDGWILMPLTHEDGHRWLVAVDPRDGEVAWWYAGPHEFSIAQPTPRGFLGLGAPDVVEVDWLGRVLRRWSHSTPLPDGAVPIDARSLHHDLLVDDEVLGVLTKEAVQVPAYPRSYAEPEVLGGPVRVEDCVVRLFDPDTGESLARWPLSERLDTARIGYNSLDDRTFGEDWVHANALLRYRGGWLVESRHQDALVWLDAAGDVGWILSHPFGWSAPFEDLLLDGLEPGDWPYHPHGPSLQGDLVVVLDNHNVGSSPYEPLTGEPERSRVIAWSIDPDAHVADVAWTWTPPGDLFSVGLGGTATLPDGTVLVDFPMLLEQGGRSNLDRGRGHKSARVMQFAPFDPVPILDLDVWTPRRQLPEGLRLYRALPVPSFWPPEVAVRR